MDQKLQIVIEKLQITVVQMDTDGVSDGAFEGKTLKSIYLSL